MRERHKHVIIQNKSQKKTHIYTHFQVLLSFLLKTLIKTISGAFRDSIQTEEERCPLLVKPANMRCSGSLLTL